MLTCLVIVAAVEEFLSAFRASLPVPVCREDFHRLAALDNLLTHGVDERQLVAEAACMRVHICPAVTR